MPECSTSLRMQQKDQRLIYRQCPKSHFKRQICLSCIKPPHSPKYAHANIFHSHKSHPPLCSKDILGHLEHTHGPEL